MDTVIVELTNLKAYKLLGDMEALNLIRLLKEPINISSLRGLIKSAMINEDIDKQLNKQLNEIRKE